MGKIIIGGGISQQDILLNLIKEEVEALFKTMEMFQVIYPEVSACKFANDANLLGALVHYLNKNS